ncbi:NAD-dependent epimerase/dehydratase family protein [Litorivicinus sp.]|nr:NAD-dependent epimerase/dehydratase family protein [Litorivicinus sp.]MDC1239973.1 NAD-dependent epimerase/dehydratase family protein [Litorivicinus sp.]
MRVIVLGGDGYLGWPTAMDMSIKGHDVCVVDNYLRRKMATDTDSEPLLSSPDLARRAELFHSLTEHTIRVEIFDCTNYDPLRNLVREFQPDTIIHYAEQPSAPYSMRGFEEANLTFRNNLNSTFNLVWACIECAPDCHIVKLGTMGEYGTPNIDIEEGWLDVSHNGRDQKFLYPRQAGSLYHTTKVLDTDLLWFYVRTYDLRVTDLMQGPVYGLSTSQCDMDPALMPHFHYDDIFGTVVNRFLVQAVCGIPLTVFGTGGQTRGYLNLLDTLQCIELASDRPAEKGELRILNQFTETFSVNELAERIFRVGNDLGLNVDVKPIANPRKELEDHYYNPKHSGLLDLGLEPHFMTDDVIASMLEEVMKHRHSIAERRIMPRVRWS